MALTLASVFLFFGSGQYLRLKSNSSGLAELLLLLSQDAPNAAVP
jgi:hypothetical protein